MLRSVCGRYGTETAWSAPRYYKVTQVQYCVYSMTTTSSYRDPATLPSGLQSFRLLILDLMLKGKRSLNCDLICRYIYTVQIYIWHLCRRFCIKSVKHLIMKSRDFVRRCSTMTSQYKQESPAIADKPARRESMPKIAPIRRAYNVVADNTGLSSCF